MIQIEKIEITEFRGIRHLVLDLNKKSFGIAGPNGTGKSGIVDAVEFALTSNITRLGGAGTAEISVKIHAPHVDSAKKPEKASVVLTGFAPSLGKQIIIERSVKFATGPKLVPDNDATRALLLQLQTHPEFALSRREIIKYILTPAGERAKEVQILLRLDQIEKARLSLQRVANDAKKDHTRAKDEDERAKRELAQHLGIQNTQQADILVAVNARRAILKLDPITDLSSKTSLKAGLAGDDAEKDKPQARLSKATVTADLTSYQGNADELQTQAFKTSAATVAGLLSDLMADPAVLKGFRQKVLVEQGIALIDDESCPLCDTEWDLAKLRAHLQEKILKASAATVILKKISEASGPIAKALENYALSARTIAKSCGLAEPKIDPSSLSEFAAIADADRGLLAKLEGDPSVIEEVQALLARIVGAFPAPVIAIVQSLAAHAKALPEPSSEDGAKEYLIVAQEKYERCHVAKTEMDMSASRETLSVAVFVQYGDVSTKALEAIYDSVQKDFTTYYSFINRDDEAKFEGTLTPSVGKLAFDVDFYGRGKFPPGAYHSEGHQDGMGLCLYLALMKHTLGDGFVLAVLDDVLMSVDAGHRREVCSLLKTHFPKTQFILTTHDPVWLQFMRTENLIQGNISFGGWSVETGPQVWKEGDVWKQIDDKLAKNDVAGAAATLRRYLEFISTILADNLHAKVEYHANGHYDLGDLWPGVVQAWKARLQEAKTAAVSWGAPTTDIEAAQMEANQRIADMQSEQWMINKAVHYNEWHNLLPQEFRKVADAYRAFLKSMQCASAACGEFLCVSPARGREREALRCGCGTKSLNLKKK